VCARGDPALGHAAIAAKAASDRLDQVPILPE
jgi:hypothetical protein